MFCHVDADSFFASVLVRKHPRLAGKPVLALGMGGSCVIAATYEAKAKGVKTGMRLSDARKLVPGAIEMPSDFRETAIASQQIEDMLRAQCPVIEQMSIDEWFLDLSTLVGGVPQNVSAWGRRTQEEILASLALSVSVGIAPTKLLAKMASEYHKPAGVTAVSAQGIEIFLRDRPAAAIPGIGRQRSIITQAQRWHTAWDIASADGKALTTFFGRPGMDMKRELSGEAVFPVTSVIQPPKSVSRCRSFLGTRDERLVRAHILKHIEYCVMKMRRWKLSCREVHVWVRNADYEHREARRKLKEAASTEGPIVSAALSCLEELMKDRSLSTQAGLALASFVSSETRQPSLFDDPEELASGERLQQALDSLHGRYGRDAVTRGSALRVRSGTVKHLGHLMIE